MTEIEKTEGEIKVLQAKLELLKEMEKHKSPVEEAYKDAYGEYPMGEPFWIVFKKGYEAHQSLVDDANKIKAAASMINCIIEGNPPNGCSTWNEWFELFGSKGILHHLRISAKEYQPKEKEQKWDIVRESVKWCKEHPDESVEDYLTPQKRGERVHKETEELITKIHDGYGVVEYQPTPQTPDKIEENLREAFKKVQQTEEWKETQSKIDSNYDEMVKNPPEFLKFELGKTLEALITRWWDDVFYGGIHQDRYREVAIDDLICQIQLWLPREQSSVIDLVDGYNDALTKIKSKLRNKK
jgi:hypothetical protein